MLGREKQLIFIYMKGTLYRNEEQVWKIKYQYGDVKLRVEDITNKLVEGQEVLFMYEKKFLAKETLWFAKIIPQHPTWESILKHYIEENENHGVDASDFYDWLKENYYPPKNK
jgi:hypothetical protein